MDELMNLVNRDASGWLCSGRDMRVTEALFRDLLEKAAEQNFIQVVILPEELLPALSPILEADLRNRGYLPSYAYGYFPAFQGETVNIRERILTLLQICRPDRENIDAVMTYVDFLSELERARGNTTQALNEEFLWNYTRASAVERVLNGALAEGELDPEEYEDWMADYAACVEGRISLKSFLNQLNDSFALKSGRRKSIAALDGGERLCFLLRADLSEEAKKLLFQMMGWDILEAQRKGKRISLSVLEGNKKYGSELLSLLNASSAGINFNFCSRDFFAGHSPDWKEKIGEYFHRFIYTAHARMESCEEISSKRFGQIPVVRSSYSCDRDRRIANYHLLDQIFDTNRVDHYIRHVPVWEPRYRKEEIHEMPEGTCLVQTEAYEGYINLKE